MQKNPNNKFKIKLEFQFIPSQQTFFLYFESKFIISVIKLTIGIFWLFKTLNH